MSRSVIKAHLDKLAKVKPLDDYCTNCSMCCRPRVAFKHNDKEHLTFINDLSCRHMQETDKGSQCGVYKDRHTKVSWCLDLEGMLAEAVAPNSCPYTYGLEGYVGPVELPDVLYKALVPLIRLDISRRNDFSKSIDPDKLNRFLSK